MDKKILVGLFLMVFLVGMVNAESSLGIFEYNTDINLPQTCASCSYNNITNIQLGNGTTIDLNVAMDKTGSYYNYTLNKSQTNSFGKYIVNGIGDPSGTDEIWVYTFEVNYYGATLSTAQSILYFGLFFIIVLVFISNFFLIGYLPSENQKDEEGKILSINKLKYLRSTLWFVEWMLFVSILYISSNLAFAYLNESLFAQVLLTLFRITLGITPIMVIVWFAWIFVKIIQDKEMQNLLNRGFFPQGRL